jgi:hypothetical protein
MSAKQTTLTLVLATLLLRLAAFTASAQQVPDYQRPFFGLPSQSAAEYVRKCENIKNDSWCLGYIGGIASGLRVAGKACIPDLKWGLDLFKDFGDDFGESYIKSHPETQQQPGEVVLAQALIQKWPCKK